MIDALILKMALLTELQIRLHRRRCRINATFLLDGFSTARSRALSLSFWTWSDSISFCFSLIALSIVHNAKRTFP